MKEVIRLTESDLHDVIRESISQILSELDWKTYANAAHGAHEWRKNNPNKYDRNRQYEFARMAKERFDQKYGLEDQWDDAPQYGYSPSGTINLNIDAGEKPSISGTRDHDFGDGDEHNLRHNVYHMGKEYGTNGGYGRTRMWDYARETTPEEFYGDEEKGQKFRQAEKDVEDFNSGKTKYVKGKGWE